MKNRIEGRYAVALVFFVRRTEECYRLRPPRRREVDDVKRELVSATYWGAGLKRDA